MREDHFVLVKRANGIWYYYVYRYGKRVFRTTGEQTKSAALQVILDRLKKEDLLNEGKNIRPMTFGEFSTPYFIWETCPLVKDKLERGGHYSKALCKANRALIDKYVIPVFGKKLLPEISPAMVNNFLRSLPIKFNLKPQSANKIFKAFRQLLDDAVAQKLLDKNPAKEVKQLIEAYEPRGCFTTDQIHTLFSTEWVSKFAETACKLAATTGMRIGEVSALCREQIKDGYILVNRAWADHEGMKTTKSGHSRIVPVLPEIKEALLNLPSNGELIFSYDGKQPLSRNFYGEHLRNHMTKCGIDYKKECLSFHSFRHFFNTRLVANGIDAERIRSVVGHESSEMTEHYLHLTSNDMDSIRKVQEKVLKTI